MSKINQKRSLDEIITYLDSNLPFLAELLQADIRLFIRKENEITIHNYFHPNQDSLYLGPRVAVHANQKFKAHKEVSVDKAFRLGKQIVGQYGLVINNRRIQEFAYPIFMHQDYRHPERSEGPIAVIAVERDIYMTRNILGRHWDFIADQLVKTIQEKINEDIRLPSISFGEGALVIQNSKVFFANPLSVNLLSEIAEQAGQLIGRTTEDIFAGFSVNSLGTDLGHSISKIEEIALRQRNIVVRYVDVGEDLSVALIKDNSEVKFQQTLLQEIHHRVKNNLHTIVSLLRLQKRRNPELEDSFNEAINRTNSIALVHEYLSRSTDIENIDFGFLVQKIVLGLVASFGADHISVQLDCPKKIFILSEHATNLALVINEVLTNTLEHTMEKLTMIKLNLYEDKQHLHLLIEDDGGGFADEFDYKNSTGLGWGIIETLVQESMKGKLTVENYQRDKQKGVRVYISIPII